MKYSMMTYSMARQGAGVEEIIQAAVDFGYDGIDWVTNYGRSAAELRRRSADAGLPVVAYTFFLGRFQEGQKDWVSDACRELDLAAELGAPLIMVPTLPLSRAATREDGRKMWIEAMARVTEEAKVRKLIATVENFPGLMSPFVTAADFMAARREVPELRLTFDDGNASGGESPVDSYLACAEWVCHAHFKDWTLAAPGEGMEQLDGRYFVPALIGEGVVDTPAVLGAMRDRGYAGYVNIEYENNHYSARESMRKAIEYLRALE